MSALLKAPDLIKYELLEDLPDVLESFSRTPDRRSQGDSLPARARCVDVPLRRLHVWPSPLTSGIGPDGVRAIGLVAREARRQDLAGDARARPQ